MILLNLLILLLLICILIHLVVNRKEIEYANLQTREALILVHLKQTSAEYHRKEYLKELQITLALSERMKKEIKTNLALLKHIEKERTT